MRFIAHPYLQSENNVRSKIRPAWNSLTSDNEKGKFIESIGKSRKWKRGDTTMAIDYSLKKNATANMFRYAPRFIDCPGSIGSTVC